MLQKHPCVLQSSLSDTDVISVSLRQMLNHLRISTAYQIWYIKAQYNAKIYLRRYLDISATVDRKRNLLGSDARQLITYGKM